MSEHIVDSDPIPILPELVVSEHGAWAHELVDATGKPVFFGKREVNGKNRGGMHVCLPNFGPDASAIFKQHGFGRETQWERTVAEDGALVYVLDHPARLPDAFEEYSDMHAELRYEVGDAYLDTTLSVRNDGSDELPLSPGFHPYFAVNDGEPVALNGRQVNLDDFAIAQLVESDSMSLVIGGRTLTLSAGDMTKWAVWTEGDHFICVEPTLDGGEFDSSNPAHVLAPGDAHTFPFTIAWTD